MEYFLCKSLFAKHFTDKKNIQSFLNHRGWKHLKEEKKIQISFNKKSIKE